MPINSDLILYLDLETTGNKDNDEIIEVGLVMLDSKSLDELGAFSVIIAPSDGAWTNMQANPVVFKMHTVNGLIDDLNRGAGVPIAQADDQIVQWINGFTKSTNHVPYGGSGVAHFDRPYINSELPRLSKRITYWALDVGSTRRQWQLAGRTDWPSQDAKSHRALDDARFHADELRFFVNQVRGEQ